MLNILMEGLAFIFFVIYDLNSTTVNNKLLRSSFFIGCFLLVAATGGLISDAVTDELWHSGRTLIFIALAILFLFLMIYTLFFAMPFEDTYTSTNKPPKACRTGFYALCRHPGAIWFAGFYASLWLALSGRELLIAGFLFVILNTGYIILQDRWTFMKVFPDYADYKKTTPFLIPNWKSLKRCILTFRDTAI